MEEILGGRMSGDAIIQAAMQMEELGKDFYEALATVSSDAETRNLCKNLAASEKEHREVFRGMRSELARRAETVLLTDRQTVVMRGMLKSQIVPDKETVRRIASTGKILDLIEMAKDIERNGIRFYRELARQVPQESTVQGIIRTEEIHLKNLDAIAERIKKESQTRGPSVPGAK